MRVLLGERKASGCQDSCPQGLLLQDRLGPRTLPRLLPLEPLETVLCRDRQEVVNTRKGESPIRAISSHQYQLLRGEGGPGAPGWGSHCGPKPRARLGHTGSCRLINLGKAGAAEDRAERRPSSSARKGRANSSRQKKRPLACGLSRATPHTLPPRTPCTLR